MVFYNKNGLLDTDLHEVSWHFTLWAISSTDRVKISVKETLQNGFLFLSHTYKANTATQSNQNDFECQWLSSSSAMTALSCLHNLTLYDWSRGSPPFTSMSKLVGMGVPAFEIQFFFTPKNHGTHGQVWDNQCLSNRDTTVLHWAIDKHHS